MADIPLRLDADPQWQAIHAAADAREGAVYRIVWAALRALVGANIIAQVRAALESRDAERAIAAIPAELTSLAPALQPILLDVATAGAKIATATPRTVETAITVALGGDVIPRTELIDWSRKHAAALVRDVSRETRWAIRRVIEEQVARSANPADTAKLLERIIGLTMKDTQAVQRYAANLLEADTPLTRLNRLVDGYATKLLRHRAQVIARHETITAANEGRRAVWEREAQAGLIDRGRWEREWVAIVPSDGRTCPYCEGQDGQRAPIEGTYPDGSSGPPGHVICRCTERLTRAA